MIDLKREWTFKSKEVAEDFDSHVREQLPWYDLVNQIIEHYGKYYIPHDGQVYDIGASTGNVSRVLEKTLVNRNAQIVGLEESEEMCSIYQGYGIILNEDVTDFLYTPFDFAVASLVFMFIPIVKRRQLLADLYDKLNEGGCILVFDKLEAGSGYLGTVNTKLALAMKVNQGVDYAEIIDKEFSLAGIQRPISKNFIDLKYPGETIFRFGDFVGYALVK